MPAIFTEDRIPLGTSTLLDRIGTILSSVWEEKDCAGFHNLFRKLGVLLRSFADMMLLSDGRCLEDVLREHLLQHEKSRPRDWNEVVDYLSCINSWSLRAEDILEKVYTEIALHQQDRKRAAAAAPARRRRGRSIALPLRLRLHFSKGKYHSTLDRLRRQLDHIVLALEYLDENAWNVYRYLLHSSKQQENKAGYPLCARGLDSDSHKEVLTSESDLGLVNTQTFPFDRPVIDIAEIWPRDEDLNAIVMRLLSDEDQTKSDRVPVLPIVGVPGVGKTTLAWLLYSNDRVCTHFRRSFWFNVSNGFDLGLIAQAIEAIAVELGWIPHQREIQGENLFTTGNVHQHRYLIILDGLKYEDQHTWSAFREFLKGTNTQVIITTRHRTAISEDSAVPYILQGLPEFYSWKYLLDNKLHGLNSTPPKTLPRFIARWVHYSAGVPLALNILRHHMNTDLEWLNCQEMVILDLSNSLADDMLRDFFVNLPDHLRDCFAYCSLFPPGQEMDKSTLVQLWMAQGFIPTQTDCDAEKLGDMFFRDLLKRSLLSETQADEFGNIRSCKMHKLMHDLSLLIAYRMIRKDWSAFCRIYYDSHWHYHHASLGDSAWWLYTPISFLKDQRTLLFLDQEKTAYSSLSHHLLEERLQNKLGYSHSLRVLDLHRVNIKRVPTSINEMNLLRYLDLSGNPNITMLPDSITRLIHLQTLKLSHCEKLKELPKDIARLENLRHLEIVGCLELTHMPCGIGQLTALRTLSMFVVGGESGTSPGVGELSELKALNHLRGKLELRHLEKARSSSLASVDLEKKECLESVALVWETTDAGEDAHSSASDDERTLEGLQLHQKLKGFSIHGYGGTNFPRWFSSLFNLVKITVKDCHSCRSLPPLHQLPRLKYLILENMDSLEYIISGISATALEGLHENSADEGSSIDAKFFPSLIHLCLKELPKLKGWLNENDATFNPNQIPSRSFPVIEDLHVCMLSKQQLENLLLQSPLSSLMSLCISYVKDLDYLPETLSSCLGSIQNLEMEYCPNLSCLPTFLVTLKSLSVVSCGLTSLPRDIQHLQALEALKVKHCFKLDLQKSHNHVIPHNDIDLKCWPQFDLAQRDHDGYLQVGEELDSSYFAGFKSLSYLEIKRLPSLVSLPDSICKLPSLQQLCLSCCDNLKYLPEGLPHIPNLYKIKINGCPLLKERCCDKTSGEWEKICHIWDRDLDWSEDQISVE